MLLSSRHFPHPVLSSISDDFANSSFEYALQVEPTIKQDAYRFSATFLLNSKTLSELISKRMAEFALHIESPISRFRSLRSTCDPSIEFSIKADDLEGEVRVNGLILSTVNMKRYASNEFNEDYSGYTFSIRKGDILAFGHTKRFRVNKYEPKRSIFVISPNPADNPCELTYSLDSERIVILLSPKNFERYRALQLPTYKHVLNTMTVFPALVSILQSLKKQDYEDGYGAEEWHLDYRNRRWYRVLEQQLNKLGITDWDIEDPLHTANELLDLVVGNALASLEEHEKILAEQEGSDEE